jgi:hypothetical protein
MFIFKSFDENGECACSTARKSVSQSRVSGKCPEPRFLYPFVSPGHSAADLEKPAMHIQDDTNRRWSSSTELAIIGGWNSHLAF